jgi:hypothetical protein
MLNPSLKGRLAPFGLIASGIQKHKDSKRHQDEARR